MKILTKTLLTFACLLPVAASAHAFLDHAVPAVGASVTGAPSTLTLVFTQRIVPALSGVTLTSGGKPVPAKAAADPADPAALLVRLGAGLTAGTYVVTWHVVSIDTHPTSGSYRFTVAP